MFSFTKKQAIVQLNEMCIGGQPGEHPTVLFPGVFFTGTPDFKHAQKQVSQLYKLSTTLNVPVIPDFFIRKESYIDDIIAFIKEEIPQDTPFSIDITDPTVKIQALQSLKDHSLLDRTVYNSIHIGITPEEHAILKQCTPAAVILVAFNPKDKSPDGKIEVLENGAHLTDKGLFAFAKDIGVANILVDTAALAPGDYSGAAIAAIPVIKEEYGLPTGCAIHNVVEKSTWLTSYTSARKPVDAASNLSIPLFGGDFAIMGPITNADIVLPMIAWQDILISEYTETYFGVSPASNHPRRKLTP